MADSILQITQTVCPKWDVFVVALLRGLRRVYRTVYLGFIGLFLDFSTVAHETPNA